MCSSTWLFVASQLETFQSGVLQSDIVKAAVYPLIGGAA